MNDLETIENYLSGQLSTEDRTRFESALRTDPAVADALAFYVLAKQAAKNEARAERQAELNALRRRPVRPSAGVPMRWAAAASIILILGLGWSVYRLRTEPVEAAQLADTYIRTNFSQLSTTMGGEADSLKTGVGLFNENKLAEAEAVFESVLTSQPTNDRALKYAGIAALRQGQYDQAIDRFHKLSQRTDLFSNPGTFYEALALLKRGTPTDKVQAKKLLQKVIDQNLEGKSEAEALLK
ncbi:tetratricopeptide repeat protein [Spirosoma soli]|uniref:Tetratricopeptide repeat protein n=1 Tax=Spirosoma soli TaxID=1770529 RepID=A0ABW5M083_9BACT